MTSSDFVSANEILTAVGYIVNDSDFKKGIPRGYYLSLVNKALEELAVDSLYHLITKDYPIDKVKLHAEKPKGLLNLREVYLFNGECCTPELSVIVHLKRLYNNGSGGSNYTAKRKENGQYDPFFAPYDLSGASHYHGVYFANEYETHLELSRNCREWQFIRFVYNGYQNAVGDEPIIPRDFRNAITDYVKVEILEIFKNRDVSYRTLWADAKNDLEGMGRKKGSWKEACDRVKMMSTWKREEYREYFSRGNW